MGIVRAVDSSDLHGHGVSGQIEQHVDHVRPYPLRHLFRVQGLGYRVKGFGFGFKG